MEHGVYILVLLPLVGFLFNGSLGKFLPKHLVGIFATGCVLVSFLISLNLFFDFDASSPPVIIQAFQWFKIGEVPIDFAFQIDPLSLMMMMIITGIGSLIHLYSIGYMIHEKGFYKFFSYLNLFVFCMLLLVMGSNYLILFIGWEGVGFCSYLLIGFWFRNENYGKAARKAFIMNRIGDLGLLVGIFLILTKTHAIDYLNVAKSSSSLGVDTPVMTFITLSLFVGAMGKSAQIPLFTWLPDAMAGPTPVSALIHAATMVTAGIYLIVRSNFLYSLAPTSMEFILYIGLATSLVAAFIALRQNDIKKVLAYSTVSQLGLLFVALGAEAYTAAMFHLLTHAFFKALLFLGAGSVIHAMGGEQDLCQMGGLKKKIPITYGTFLIATLAISGVPPLSGMISKDEILLALYAENPIIWGLALFSAALTGMYMFRLLFLTFFGNFRGTEEQKKNLHESPISMTLPLIILGGLSAVGGLLNLPHFIGHGAWQLLDHWLRPIYTHQGKSSEVHFTTEMWLLGVTVLVTGLVFFMMKRIYADQDPPVVPEDKYSGWEKLSAKKLYLDPIYNILITKPVEYLGKGLSIIDKHIVDGLVKALGKNTSKLGYLFKRVQNGNAETYLLIMSLSIGIILIVNFILP